MDFSFCIESSFSPRRGPIDDFDALFGGLPMSLSASALSCMAGLNPAPSLSRSGRLVELAPQLADLVAQLGRVLEAELLGGGEHLLLELHDRLLDLVRLHVDALLAPAA